MKNLKTTIALIALSACMLTFSACDDKDYNPRSPQFGELILDKTTYAPGESVKAIGKVKTEGEYYYYYRIYYTVAGVTNIIEKADINTKTGDVEFEITAPSKAGSYPMSMKCSVSYTANGQLYGETNSVSTTLVVEE